MSRLRPNKKAQVFSPDLMIGLSIAIIIFAVMIAAWARFSVRINENIAYEDMVFRAMAVSDVLIKDSSLGIASSHYVLDPGRVADFVSEDYDSLRERFNIKPNGFYLSISVNGSVIAEKGTESSEKPVAAVRRAALYNGTGAVVDFRIKEK